MASSNWFSKSNLGDGPACPKPPRQINMDRINRLASPKFVSPKFETKKPVHSTPRCSNDNGEHCNKKIPTPCQPRKHIPVNKAVKTPSDDTAPRSSDRISPSIIASHNQPRPTIASELSLKMGCGDSSKNVAANTNKKCNMNRIVLLSQPRLIVRNPDIKCNPFKVAKSATNPLSSRRARHIELLAQVPKRKMQGANKSKKKLISKKKIVQKILSI